MKYTFVFSAVMLSAGAGLWHLQGENLLALFYLVVAAFFGLAAASDVG